MNTQEQLNKLTTIGTMTTNDYTVQTALWAIIFNSSQYLNSQDGFSSYEPLENETWQKTFLDTNGEEAYENVPNVPQGNYDVLCGGGYLSSITI